MDKVKREAMKEGKLLTKEATYSNETAATSPVFL